MQQAVSFLRPAAARNPATQPVITEALRESLQIKTNTVVGLLKSLAQEFGGQQFLTFANSFGAEDMVLTDMILRNGIDIEIFSLDTGRLPQETYTLMADAEKHYDTRFQVYFPLADQVENYVREHGINAFYESIDLRKACCYMRKVEPLQRALQGKKAWITGLRAQQAATRTDMPVREFDSANGLEKINPLLDWSEPEVWAYIREHEVPYNALHDQFYPSIGCAPCTRSIAVGEDIRAGRWWWENPDSKECGLHKK